MKNECIIEGQINIFELSIIETIKPKGRIVNETSNVKSSKLDYIVKIYSENCSRIVRTLSGALLVEIENKTLYFNSNGVNEFELPKNVGIMPGEEILIANVDRELNDIQRQKLEALKPKEYIKRKGDANLIMLGEKTIVINPKGWVLEYNQKPRYHPNEIFATEFNSKSKDIDDIKREIISDIKDVGDKDFKVDDKVDIQYRGIKTIGKVVRIYNNGETLNVEWDGEQTAFYYNNVSKVE